MRKPKYSFILPIYKVEMYLPKCIDSILKQSISDFEVILVDDGSPDKCPNICDKYAKKDSRIKVIHKKNAGLCDARNAGLKKAKGEYILFVDPDDYIEKNYLEVIDREADEYDMLVFSYNALYKNKKIKKFGENNIITAEEAQKYLVQDDKFCGYVWNKAYRKEIIDKYNLKFDNSVTISEDILFTYQFLEHSFMVKLVDESIINYRQRNNSIILTPKKDLNVASIIKTYVYIINNTSDEDVKLKCMSLYLKSFYKYKKVSKPKDFDIILIKNIINNYYFVFSNHDKKIILIYKYIPFIKDFYFIIDKVFNVRFS